MLDMRCDGCFSMTIYDDDGDGRRDKIARNFRNLHSKTIEK